MTQKSKTGNVINIKTGLAEMLKGGVIMDVVTADQAKVAEDAGAVAVMALERVPSDIPQGRRRRAHEPARTGGGDYGIRFSIPVMAKCRIGHFAEAQILQAIGVDYIDESEVLTPADEDYHINKHDFKVPFVCGAKNLGEALRRIGEGAALMRTKGEPGTGNIVEAVRHLRQINQDIKRIMMLDDQELMTEAKNLGAPYELVKPCEGTRAPACAEFRGGRHRYASRCGAVHAARRGNSFRRLGYFQIRKSRPVLPRRLSKRPRISMIRKWCSKPPRAWAIAMRGYRDLGDHRRPRCGWRIGAGK
jgi:pyridoxal 5'-phosphate synthase pdxS subunit